MYVEALVHRRRGARAGKRGYGRGDPHWRTRHPVRGCRPPLQDLRRSRRRRAARRRPDDPGRRARRLPRAQRLRQVHPARAARRHPAPQRRQDLPRRRGGLADGRALPRPDPLAPGLDDAPGRDAQPPVVRHRAPEHRLRPALAVRRRARGRPGRHRAPRPGRAARPGRPGRLHDVRRPAPAPRPRLRRLHLAAPAARRRADQPAQPRRPRPRAAPDPLPRRRLRHHDRGGHPPARGGRDLPAHGDDEGRPRRGRGPRRVGVRRGGRGRRPPPARPHRRRVAPRHAGAVRGRRAGPDHRDPREQRGGQP